MRFTLVYGCILTLSTIVCAADDATPTAISGRVLVKSEPPGAAITLLLDGGAKRDTGKVTPSLVELPIGRQSLELSLSSYKTGALVVEVSGVAIQKPDLVKLEPITVRVDVLFEEGWGVFVDGKAAKTPDGATPRTPCTVELALGRRDIALAKEGFTDIRQLTEVTEAGVRIGDNAVSKTLQISAKPAKGRSVLASGQPTTGRTLNLLPLIRPAEHSIEGQWSVVNGCLVAEPGRNGQAMRCTVPYLPPAEYNLKVTFTRAKGQHIMQMLVGNRVQFDCCYDLFGRGEYGFATIDGKFVGQNASTVRGEKLQNGQKYSSVIQVRKDGVTAYLNGKVVCQYKTDYGNMGLESWWKVPNGCLGVGCHQGSVIFHEICIEEVTGEGAPSGK